MADHRAIDLTICVTVDADIRSLNPEGQAAIMPPSVNSIRKALFDSPFADYILGVALMGERSRAMTAAEIYLSITGDRDSRTYEEGTSHDTER